MRALWILVFVVACKERVTTCERVAETAREIHPGGYRLTLEHCQKHRWPESRRACAAAAKTREAFTACDGAHLVVEVPPDAPPVVEKIEDAALVVELRADGSLLVDGKPITEAALDALLADLKARDPNAKIGLRGEAAASTRLVNDFVQRVRAAGFEQIVFDVR